MSFFLRFSLIRVKRADWSINAAPIALKALGVDCKDFQWAIRRSKTANPCLSAWAKRMRHQWWPESMKYIAPPAKNYVGEHSKWAGILPLDQSGKGIGKLFATAIYFSAIGTGVSNQNAANNRDKAGHRKRVS